MLCSQEKLFNQLLTERVCPLIIKLFSPSSKYRHSNPSPVTAALLAADKPTFALSVRLLRILSVLIREFYSCLVRVHTFVCTVHIDSSCSSVFMGILHVDLCSSVHCTVYLLHAHIAGAYCKCFCQAVH